MMMEMTMTITTVHSVKSKNHNVVEAKTQSVLLPLW